MYKSRDASYDGDTLAHTRASSGWEWQCGGFFGVDSGSGGFDLTVKIPMDDKNFCFGIAAKDADVRFGV